MARTEPDLVFRLAEMPDPFLSNPFVRALMDLPPVDRKRVVRMAAVLCAVIEGLDTPGALELLAQVAPYLEVKRS